MKVALGGLFVVAAACRETASILLPTEIESAPSILVLINESQAEGYTRGTPLDLRTDAANHAEALILALPLPLKAYGLTEGPVRLGPIGAPLPTANVILATAFDDSRRATFVRIAELPPLFDSQRLEGVLGSPRACLEVGGCIDVRESCQLPCAFESGPTAPQQPALPVPPTAPDLACPEAWTSREGCRPAELPPRLVCSAGTVQFYGEDNCTTVGSACADQFSTPPLNRAVRYVALGGDGDGLSPSAPAGNLDQIITSAPEHAAIMLGQGEFTVLQPLARSLEIWGTCATQTRLRTATQAISIEESTVGLHQLSLDALRISGSSVSASGLAVTSTISLANSHLSLRKSALITNADTAIVVADGTLSLDQVIIEGAIASAIVVHGEDSHVEASGVQVHQVCPDPSLGRLLILNGGTARMTHVSLETDARDLIAVGGWTASATLADIKFLRWPSSTPSTETSVILGLEGARINATRISIDGAPSRGIVTSQGSIEVEHLVQKSSSGYAGMAVDGGTLNIRHAQLEGYGAPTFYCENSECSFVDLTLSMPAHEHRAIAFHQEQGHFRMERTALDLGGAGLYVNSTYAISDVVMQSAASGASIHGSGSVDRVQITGSFSDYAISASGRLDVRSLDVATLSASPLALVVRNATVSLSQLRISGEDLYKGVLAYDTRLSISDFVQEGGQDTAITLERTDASFERLLLTGGYQGFDLDPAAQVIATDITMRDVLQGAFSKGELSLRRAELLNVRRAGISSLDAGKLNLTELRIVGSDTGGPCIFVSADSKLNMRGFELESCEVGLHARRFIGLVSDGRIHGHRTAAVSFDAESTLERLLRVTTTDNNRLRE